MDCEEKLPHQLLVMADFGGAYVFDEDSCSMDLEDYYIKYPELESLEKEMEEWSYRLYDCLGNEENFPWEEYHETGFQFAQRLAKIMEKEPIEIGYWRPFEDPHGRDCKPIILKKGPETRTNGD